MVRATHSQHWCLIRAINYWSEWSGGADRPVGTLRKVI